MEEFLKLRGSNEQSIARWTAILEDNFTLVIPITQYRKMVHQEFSQQQESISRNVSMENTLVGVDDEGFNLSSESVYHGKTEQILRGIEEVMADASNLAAFLVKCYSGENLTGKVGLSYDVKRPDFLMDGFNAALKWIATTHSLESFPNLISMNFKGSMQATFSP